MGRNVPIGSLADTIMDTLEEYADLAAEDVKQAVKDAGDVVKDDIRQITDLHISSHPHRLTFWHLSFTDFFLKFWWSMPRML